MLPPRDNTRLSRLGVHYYVMQGREGAEEREGREGREREFAHNQLWDLSSRESC